MKTTRLFPVPGNSELSITLRDGYAEIHLWTGPSYEDYDILTGAGFFPVMAAVKAAIAECDIHRVLIVACDDKRQRVFDRYAKRCGGVQVAGKDPDGDPCMLWEF